MKEKADAFSSRAVIQQFECEIDNLIEEYYSGKRGQAL